MDQSNSLTRQNASSQFDPQLAAETRVIAGIVLVTASAIGSTVGIVLLSEAAAAQVAPTAIGTIGAVALAAIGAVGVVLRRKPRTARR